MGFSLSPPNNSLTMDARYVDTHVHGTWLSFVNLQLVGWVFLFLAAPLSGSILPLCSQVLRETKFHLLVGQTAILSQDWESAEMSLQLAVDMSGSVKNHRSCTKKIYGNPGKGQNKT